VDGKRIRSKVSGQTKAEVKDKLKALHSELDAGIRTTAAYTVEKAVADWLDQGLPGRAAKTVEVNRDSLRPLLAIIGTIPLRDLTVQNVRIALKKMAATHATRTLQKAHNCLTRAVRHAEGQDLVRRNVSALVDTPRGAGRAAIAVADGDAGQRAAGGGGGHRYDGTPRISDGRLTAEQQTATRFRRDRRAPLIPSPGPPMPYACRPVMPSSAMSISRHRS
jgi:hypothetical protein